jgi:RNA polymerase sigma-B factor
VLSTSDPVGVVPTTAVRPRELDPVPDDRALALSMFDQLAGAVPGSREHEELRDWLVRRHLPLVEHLARRYVGRGEPLEDLIQAGSLGLVNAVDRYDPTRGLAFSTFAVPTIVGEIRRHFRDRTWSVHVQRALQERTGRVERCVRELTQELGRAPSVPELAARATLSDEDVLEALRCSAAYRTMSLDMPVSEDTTLGGLLGGEDKAYDDVDLRESLTAMFARLPERERRILRLRFFGNMTQSQIADCMGVSQMHISRLLGRTLARLREEFIRSDIA